MYAGRQAPPSGQFADAYESQHNLNAYHGDDLYESYGGNNNNYGQGPSDEKSRGQHHAAMASDYTLAKEEPAGLDDAADRDYGRPIPRQQPNLPRASVLSSNTMTNRRVDRGSVAAQMAAAGEIPKKTGLRMWRNEEHKGSFTRGGRGKCFGRCCCCTLVIALLIVVGVIAGFLLWVRPPNVEFYGIDNPSVKPLDNGFDIDITINIGVQNPNFFGATFNSIKATGFYPTDDTQKLGGGTLKNLHIGANTNNTIHFPFNVNYTTDIDPSGAILKDIATKCGIIKGKTGQLTVNYDLKLDVRLAAITVSPTVSSSATFDCPLTSDDLSGLLDGILKKRDSTGDDVLQGRSSPAFSGLVEDDDDDSSLETPPLLDPPADASG